MKSLFIRILAIPLVFFLLFSPLRAEISREPPEKHVKTLLLYYLAKYVSWPEHAHRKADKVFNFCITGRDALRTYFDQFVAETTVQGRKLHIVEITPQADVLAHNCHALFIGSLETGRVMEILGELALQPILTVSDVENFTALGGMVEFYREYNKPRVKLNHDRLRWAGLKAGSGLLRISKLVGGGIITSAVEPEDIIKEYRLKAGFLYNFARLTDWPQKVFTREDDTFTVCVLGQNPFTALESTLGHKNVQAHPIRIHYLGDPLEMGGCQVLFISASETARLKTILKATLGRPILTVSDIKQFAEKGGMIELYSENNTIRLRMNLDMTRWAELRVSSRIAKLAQIVKSGAEAPPVVPASDRNSSAPPAMLYAHMEAEL